MIERVLTADLQATALLAVVDAAAALLLVALLRPPRGRRARWRLVAAAAVAGGVSGLGLTWWLGDVLDVVGVPPTLVDRVWIAATFSGMGVAVAVLWRGPGRRRGVAVASVVVFVLAGALAVNRDAGAYRHLAQVMGRPTLEPLAPPPLSGPDAGAGGGASSPAVLDAELWASWRPPADLPERGRSGRVTIPGTRSGFAARDAVVWLPPAALVADPPALPVVLVLSGQPASPESVVTAGHLVDTLEAFATANRGLAPIAVVPDQLGADTANPMCVDGPLGNSATYITEDVVEHVSSHYRAAEGPRAWAIAGFSQGGTCASQFGAGRPDLFGSFVDVSGELGPSIGTRDETIRRGFGGDAAAYEAAQPLALFAAHAPYADSVGFFAVGSTDATFRRYADEKADAARRAGVQVTRWDSPGSGHDWTTATNGFAHGIASFFPRWGLSAEAPVP